MAANELSYPTSVRAVLGADVGTDVLVTGMTGSLPPEGAAAPHLRGRFTLTRATWRLLDSRVLAAAAEILDLDVARPLVGWLATYERLLRAAEKSRAPAGEEVTEVLLPPYPLTIADHLAVAIRFDGAEVAEVGFGLTVSMALGETSAVVRRGAIEEVACEACRISASLTLDGWQPPLWQPEPVVLPVRLVVRPPIPVPLVPSPRAADEGPRRATARPPVPSSEPRR
jgi:hypothetical protein